MKKIAKNKLGEYETNDLWYRILPGITHHYFGMVRKILCWWMEGKGVVLDFGCGQQRIKDILPKYFTYIGYDTIPEYTDIGSYRGVNPDIVLAMGVLEHLTDEEMDDFLEWVVRVKPRQILVALLIKDRPILWTLMGFMKKIRREHFLEEKKYDIENIYKKLREHLCLKREFTYHNQHLTEWVKK